MHKKCNGIPTLVNHSISAEAQTAPQMARSCQKIAFRHVYKFCAQMKSFFHYVEINNQKHSALCILQV